MPEQQFEGRSAAEAAIKACETFGVSRGQLQYDVLSDEGEALDRRVVIKARTDAAPVSTEPEPGEEPPRRSEVSHEARGAGRSDGRGGGGGGGRGRRDGGRARRDERGGGRGRGGNDRGGRGGNDRGGRGGRGRRNRPEDNDGIENLLQLETVPAERPADRPELSGEFSVRAQKAMEVVSEVVRLAGFSLTHHLVQDDDTEIHVDLRGADEARVIGPKGEVLLSLQFIVNRIVGRLMDFAEGGDEGTPRDESENHRQVVVLDAADYRNRRRLALADLATRLSDRAIEEGKVVRLSPMSAHDRRVFHMTLKELEDVETRSEGDGLYRNLLIIPSEYN